MTVALLQLADFKFNSTTIAFAQLTRKRQFLWAAIQRFGGRPSLQYVGEGARTLSIPAVIYTAEGPGIYQIAEIEELAEKGVPHLMVAGTGAILGYWVIEDIDTTESYFLVDGVPLKQDFGMSLSYYGERYPAK